MMLPLQNITQVITPVMHPIFSDFQDDKAKLASSYERIVRILSFIGLPMSVLLFFTAQEVTLIIFGNQWLPSVPVFRILSLSVGVQIILSSSAPFSGCGRHPEPVHLRRILIHPQRGGNADWYLLFRHAHRSGNLYRIDIYRQLRAMLLADVSCNVPEKGIGRSSVSSFPRWQSAG
jgi:hypothetical protein